MISGKQALLYFLEKYSQAFQKEEVLSKISTDLRIAFLLHGSTSDEMWSVVNNIEWGSKKEKGDEITNQGLKIKNKEIMLSELFERIVWDDKIPDTVAKQFPKLKQKEYEAATHIIHLLLTSFEWSKWLSKIENDGIIDLKALNEHLEAYKKKLEHFGNC